MLKGDSAVNGVITFTQESEGGPVTVSGDVSGFLQSCCFNDLWNLSAFFVTASCYRGPAAGDSESKADRLRSRTSTPTPRGASTSSESTIGFQQVSS